MKDKLKLRRSEKSSDKSDRDHSKSGYSRRRTPSRDLNQYDQDRITNAEPENDLREEEKQKSGEFDLENEEERENRRRSEGANPPEESMV